MSELIVSRESTLPANINDLSKFVLIGREKLVAVRAEIRAIDKVGLAQEVREQKLREAQEISEAVLDAEVRIGELMSQVPKEPGRRNDIEPVDTDVQRLQPTRKQLIERAGFTQKQVQRFEALAAHPEIVEQAKADARADNDIVSRAKVLQLVKAQKKAEAKAKKIEHDEKMRAR